MSVTYLICNNNTDINHSQHVAVSKRVGTSICNEDVLTAHGRVVDVGRQTARRQSYHFNVLIHLFQRLIHHTVSKEATGKYVRVTLSHTGPISLCIDFLVFICVYFVFLFHTA